MKKILVCCLIFSMLLLTGCGEFHRTGGVDYYYEEGRYLSDFETTRDYVYSVYFVKKFETIDFCFHYYLALESISLSDIFISAVTMVSSLLLISA